MAKGIVHGNRVMIMEKIVESVIGRQRMSMFWWRTWKHLSAFYISISAVHHVMLLNLTRPYSLCIECIAQLLWWSHACFILDRLSAALPPPLMISYCGFFKTASVMRTCWSLSTRRLWWHVWMKTPAVLHATRPFWSLLLFLSAKPTFLNQHPTASTRLPHENIPPAALIKLSLPTHKEIFTFTQRLNIPRFHLQAYLNSSHWFAMPFSQEERAAFSSRVGILKKKNKADPQLSVPAPASSTVCASKGESNASIAHVV